MVVDEDYLVGIRLITAVGGWHWVVSLKIGHNGMDFIHLLSSFECCISDLLCTFQFSVKYILLESYSPCLRFFNIADDAIISPFVFTLILSSFYADAV